MLKAIFIDKDGTLIPDIPYNSDPGLVILNETAAEGLKKLVGSGFILIVITNQSGIAMGYYNEATLSAIKVRIEELLMEHDIRLVDFLYCPHDPEGKVKKYARECECRKPKSGLLFQAASRWNIRLSSSWMLGDILNDVEAGNRAGCKTILINNGNETEWQNGEFRVPDYIAATITEAAEYILMNEDGKRLDGM